MTRQHRTVKFTAIHLLDKEQPRRYSVNSDWRDVRAVEGGGLENR